MERHNSLLCVPPQAGAYPCKPLTLKRTLAILALLAGYVFSIAGTESENLLMEQSIRMDNPDGAGHAIGLQGVPITEGTLSVTELTPGRGFQSVMVSRNNRWIVEFVDPDPVPSGAKVPPLASSYPQLKGTGQPGSSSPLGKTALHVQFKEDLQGLAGIPQASQSSGTDEPVEPAVVYEYANLYLGAAAQLSRRQAAVVSELPYVKRVTPDIGIRALDNDSNQIIGVPQVQGPYGLTGQGVVIAVVDTGIDQNHPVFEGKVFLPGYDFVEEDADPYDDNGHGTHCAGIAAADNFSLSGVAPKADLMAVKVLDANGVGYYSDVMAGIEYAVDPDGDPGTPDGADIISLSLGGSGDPDDPLSQVVDEASQRGVLCVAAAGNRGNIHYRIDSPGCAREALTVGASIDDERIASFSSYGPTSGEPLLKPDLLAPGYYINSSLPGGGFGIKSGTSMATPHVAGAAALLMQQHPDWSVSTIKARLVQSARDLGYEAFAQGRGLLDLLAAVTDTSVLSPATVSLGQVYVEESVITREFSLELVNTSSGTQTYYMSAGMPDGVEVIFDMEEIIMGPGGRTEIPITLIVDNSILENAPDGLPYIGRIMAATMSDSFVTRVTFLKSQYITLNFDEEPYFIYIQDEEDTGRFIYYPELTSKVNVTPGSYDLITRFDGVPTFHFSGTIDVGQDSPPMVLDVKKADCVHRVTIEYTNEYGEPVSPAAFQFSRLHIHRTGLENGLLVSSGSLDELYFSDTAYRIDIANSFVSGSGDLHGHSHSLDGVQGDLTLKPSLESLQVARMKWDGDGFESGYIQPIIPYLSDSYGSVQYYLPAATELEHLNQTPATWRFISSGHPSEDTALGLKSIMVISPIGSGNSVQSMHASPFDLSGGDFRVMSGHNTEIGRISLSDEPLQFGGSPTVFSGEVEVLSWALNLRNFAFAPAFFYHPGHASITMRPDGQASTSDFTLRKDGSVIETGTFEQSGMNTNLRYLQTPGSGNYSLSVEHAWNMDNQFDSVSRFTFDFPGRLVFKPRLPGSIYLLDEAGMARNALLGNQTGARIQIHYPDNSDPDAIPGIHQASIVSGSHSYSLDLNWMTDTILEAEIPSDLPTGEYDLNLAIVYSGGRQAAWNIEPMFVAAPFQFYLSQETIEDYLPAGTLAAQFISSDNVENVLYELVPGKGDTHNAYFSITDDKLIVEATVDHFSDPVLSVRIRATTNEYQIEQVVTLSTEPRDFEVDFPDAELERQIREKLNIPLGPLTRLDLLSLQGLYVENIQDLTGLQYAIHLNYLELYEVSQVDTAILSNLRYLKRLVLSGVELDDLRWLRHFPLLSQFLIKQSIVGEWAIEMNTDESVGLTFRETNLEGMPTVSGASSILYLILENCPLRSLDGIEAFFNLNTVHLETQALDSLDPLGNLEFLDYLSLDISLIEDPSALQELNLNQLDLRGFANSKHSSMIPGDIMGLSIYDGVVESADFISGLTKLQFLYLQNCSLRDLPDLSALQSLVHLYLSGNKISDIAELANVRNLNRLDLSSNFVWDVEPLLDLPALERVDLRNNYIDVSEGSGQLAFIHQLINEREVNVDYADQLEIQAEAGPDIMVDYFDPAGTPVILDASASLGPIDLFSWSWEGGTADGETAEALFLPGTHEVTLTVVDPTGRLDTDTVIVSVASLSLDTGADILLDYPEVGTSIGTLLYNQGDVDGIELKLVSGLGDDNNDLFEIVDNKLVVKKTFDYYDWPVLNIRIQAIGVGISLEQIISITTSPRDFVVEIPDPNLRYYLEAHLGLPAREITRFAINSLESFSLHDVEDWTGLEHGINLFHLSIGGSTRLDNGMLSSFKKLYSLSLSYVALEDLRWLSAIPNLSVVSLYDSTVEDWTFELNTGGTVSLVISNCNLERFPTVLGDARITSLDLSRCPLNSLEGIQAHDLTALQLNEQDMDSLDPLLALGQLDYLDLDLNHIKDANALADLSTRHLTLIGFDSDQHAALVPRDIRYLNLIDGQIRDAGFLSEMADIYQLHVENCRLQDLPDLSGCAELKYLNLESNYIWNLEPLLGLNALYQLDLSRNYIDDRAGSIQLEYINQIRMKGVIVAVGGQLEITADAGDDISIDATDINGATVLLDASGSLGPVSSYQWSWEDGLSEGQQIEAMFPAGATEVTLTIEDYSGRTATDTVFVLVSYMDLRLTAEELLDYPELGTVAGEFVLPEDGEAVTLQLVSGTGDTNNELFEIQANQLIFRETFDHYTHPELSIRVRVTGESVAFTQVFTMRSGARDFEVDIPEPSLNLWIKEQLALSGDSITRFDLEALDRLVLLDVQDWTGLEHAVNVSKLYINGNTLVDPERVARFSKVSQVFVYQAEVADFRWLNGFPILDHVNIEETHADEWIFDIVSTHTVGLSIVKSDLAQNPILNENARLVELLLSDCPVQSLDGIEAFHELGYLRLPDLQVSSLDPLLDLENLYGLQISLDQIIDASALPGLQIEELAASGFDEAAHVHLLTDGLIHLTLSSSDLTDGSFLSGMTDLTSLVVQDSSLSTIPDLSQCTELKDLHLSENEIWDIEPLLDIPSLSSCVLNRNYIDLSEGSIQLEYLNQLINEYGVTVIYQDQQEIFVEAGPDQNIEAVDMEGALVLLDASGSLGPIDTFTWTWEGGSAEGEQAEVVFAPGTTLVTLTGVDPMGRIHTDTHLINISFMKLELEYAILPDYPVIGTEVGAIVNPQGSSGDFALELVAGSGDTNNEIFELQENRLLIAKTFNHYDFPVLSFRIRFSDGVTSFEQVFSVETEAGDFPVEIPDPRLSIILLDRLGIPVGEITRRDLESLDVLVLQDIEDWSGLEYAINVTNLAITGSTVPDPDVLSVMESIDMLSIHEADLINFHWLKYFPLLEYVSIHGTEADDWSFEIISDSFRSLNIIESDIGSIPRISGDVQLRSLLIRNCSLNNLEGIEAFPELSSLNLAGTEVPSLDPLNSLSQLSSFSASLELVEDYSAIYDLEIASLELSGFDSRIDVGILNSNLESLNLSDSTITDVGFLRGLSNLRFLGLEYCSLEEIPDLSYPESLIFLNLSNNRIQGLSSLVNLSSLEHLDLLNNRLWDIEPLFALPALESVSLDGNYLLLDDHSTQMQYINRLIDEEGVNVSYANQNSIQADAGPDLDINFFDPETGTVVLDATASLGPLVSYEWSWPEGSATGEQVEVQLPEGIYSVTLAVTDPYGRTDTDIVRIWVSAFGFRLAAQDILDYPDPETLVGEFNTAPQDPSGFIFELIDVTENPHNQFFEIRGNQLYAVGAFSHFQYPLLNVGVRCRNGDLVRERTFTFTTKASDYIVDIPDPNLEAELSELTNLPAGQIKHYKIASLESISLNGVQDWTGLEHAVNLRELYIYDSDYLDLELLQNMENLESLFLTDVDVDNLDWLERMQNLRSFSVTDMSLQDWSLPTTISEGMVLQVNNSNLDSIAQLNGAGRVVDLRISRCRDLDLSGLDLYGDLVSLTLQDMGMDEVPDLRSLSNLEYLNLHGNHIREIDVNRLPHSIERILLLSNEIRDMAPLLDLDNLKMVDVSANYMDLLRDPVQAAVLQKLRYEKSVIVHANSMITEIEARIPNKFTGMASLDGVGVVQLDASQCTGAVSHYQWSWDGGQADGLMASVSFPEGTTVIRLTIQDFVGNAKSVDGLVSVVPWIRMPGEGPGAVAWLQTELADLPESLRHPDADPDGDGLNNLLEYAFVRDPMVPEASPILDIQRISSLNNLTFRFRNDDPELHLSISRSADLINWESTGIYISTEDYRWIIDDRLYKISTTYQDDGTWLINLTAPRAADVEQYFRLDLIQVE